MTIHEMLNQSIILTLLGMAVVFSFLVIMILAMTLLHSVLHALKLDTIPPDAPEKGSQAPSVQMKPASDSGTVVAAITAFLKEKQAL